MVNHNVYRVADKYLQLWLILGFIFLLLGGGVLASVYLDYTPTETERITETETERVEMESEVSSNVQQPNQFFEDKETISGPIHFLYSDSTLELTQTFDSEREATVNNEVFVSINGTARGFQFWNERFVVTDESIQVNGTKSVTNSIDISEYRERSAEIRDAYRQEGIVTVNIVVNSSYSTERYSGSLTNSSRLQFRDSVYTVVPPNLSDTSVGSYTEVVGTEETENPIYMNAGIALIGIGLLFIFVRLFVADPNRVRKDYIMMRFSEWLSVADSENTDISDKSSKICVDSCEDLVDIAADSSLRAIVIDDEDRVIAMGDDIIYEHEISDEDRQPVRFDLFGSNSGNETDDEDSGKNSSDTTNENGEQSDNKDSNLDDSDEDDSDEDDNSQTSGFMFTD